MDQNTENIDFSLIVYSNFTTMVSPEIKLLFFAFLGTFLIRSIGYLRPKLLYLLRKYTVSKKKKKKARGAVPP